MGRDGGLRGVGAVRHPLLRAARQALEFVIGIAMFDARALNVPFLAAAGPAVLEVGAVRAMLVGHPVPLVPIRDGPADAGVIVRVAREDLRLLLGGVAQQVLDRHLARRLVLHPLRVVGRAVRKGHADPVPGRIGLEGVVRRRDAGHIQPQLVRVAVHPAVRVFDGLDLAGLRARVQCLVRVVHPRGPEVTGCPVGCRGARGPLLHLDPSAGVVHSVDVEGPGHNARADLLGDGPRRGREKRQVVHAGVDRGVVVGDDPRPVHGRVGAGVQPG